MVAMTRQSTPRWRRRRQTLPDHFCTTNERNVTRIAQAESHLPSTSSASGCRCTAICADGAILSVLLTSLSLHLFCNTETQTRSEKILQPSCIHKLTSTFSLLSFIPGLCPVLRSPLLGTLQPPILTILSPTFHEPRLSAFLLQLILLADSTFFFSYAMDQRKTNAISNSSASGNLDGLLQNSVYKNCRLMHNLTSLIGATVEIEITGGERYEGIFKTFSPKVSMLDVE